jgi:ABC-type multidrug transport system permease subunit
MWKFIAIVALILGFIGALVGLVALANKKDVSTLQILALALDIAYFPSAFVLILWLLGVF